MSNHDNPNDLLSFRIPENEDIYKRYPETNLYDWEPMRIRLIPPQVEAHESSGNTCHSLGDNDIRLQRPFIYTTLSMMKQPHTDLELGSYVPPPSLSEIAASDITILNILRGPEYDHPIFFVRFGTKDILMKTVSCIFVTLSESLSK